MSYHQFKDDEGQPYGSFEVWFSPGNEQEGEEGWYWWACFPGCMPDGDAIGPFATEQEAIDDAQEES